MTRVSIKKRTTVHVTNLDDTVEVYIIDPDNQSHELFHLLQAQLASDYVREIDGSIKNVITISDETQINDNV